MGESLDAGTPSSGSGTRIRDPELTDFENDLLELIAQAKLGLHSRVHVPASARDGSLDNGSGSQ